MFSQCTCLQCQSKLLCKYVSKLKHSKYSYLLEKAKSEGRDRLDGNLLYASKVSDNLDTYY